MAACGVEIDTVSEGAGRGLELSRGRGRVHCVGCGPERALMPPPAQGEPVGRAWQAPLHAAVMSGPPGQGSQRGGFVHGCRDVGARLRGRTSCLSARCLCHDSPSHTATLQCLITRLSCTSLHEIQAVGPSQLVAHQSQVSHNMHSLGICLARPPGSALGAACRGETCARHAAACCAAAAAKNDWFKRRPPVRHLVPRRLSGAASLAGLHRSPQHSRPPPAQSRPSPRPPQGSQPPLGKGPSSPWGRCSLLHSPPPG